jgi:HlyD family secretion protein
MQRKTWLTGGVAVLALAGVLAWAFAPRPLAVEVASATQGRFETTIDEDARTRVVERYVVHAPLAGRLQRLTLREGDVVAANGVLGTLLPAFSPLLDERSLRELQARVGAAEAGTQRAGTRIEAAKVGVEQAKNELRRSEQLAAQGFVAPTKIDADRLAALAAQKELETAIDSQHVARHELEQARAALGAARGGNRDGFALRSPVAGRVLKLHQTSETVVPLGAPLVEVGDTTKLEVVAELLTTDALAARAGSIVRIERWGGPGTLLGRVRRVEPAAFTKVSALGVEEQRVNVLIEITSAPAEWAALGDGFRVAVRIVTRSEDRVLRVPVSAVFPRTDGDGFAAFVVEDGRARLRPLSVAARNGQEAWVQDGLAEGATVIVYPGAAVVDGARVKPRKV